MVVSVTIQTLISILKLRPGGWATSRLNRREDLDCVMESVSQLKLADKIHGVSRLKWEDFNLVLYDELSSLIAKNPPGDPLVVRFQVGTVRVA